MSVTIEVNKATIEKMKSFYEGEIKPSPNEYISLFVSSDDYTISVYNKERNGFFKAVFQGYNAENEAKIWGATPKEPKPKASLTMASGQIGSDEVGTGDFFGPVCVVSSFITKKDLPRLKELGVTDSKCLSDEKILSIGPILVKEFDYSSLTLDNKKYNEVHDKGLNMNAIKAIMHNTVLLNLKKKHKDADVTIDQFAEPKTYFKYLKGEKEVLKDIAFSTKGEKVFPSVALSSCIARYSFLKHMEKLSQKLGKQIPLGAGPIVDEFAAKLAKEKGLEALDEIVKKNFANYKKLSN